MVLPRPLNPLLEKPASVNVSQSQCNHVGSFKPYLEPQHLHDSISERDCLEPRLTSTLVRKKKLSDPNLKWITEVPRAYKDGNITNIMFSHTLCSERGIKAHFSFYRPCMEPDTVLGVEGCFLVAIGDGLDGRASVSHGGFNCMLLDQILDRAHTSRSVTRIRHLRRPSQSNLSHR